MTNALSDHLHFIVLLLIQSPLTMLKVIDFSFSPPDAYECSLQAYQSTKTLKCSTG